MAPSIDFTHELAGLPQDEAHLRMPLHVFIGEAVDAASYQRRYQEPQTTAAGVALPGMSSAKLKLAPEMPDEILALVEQVQQAQVEYVLAATPNLTKDKLARAGFLVDELDAALDWLFDDGVEDEKDAQLATLKSTTESDAIDAQAILLGQYAALARPHAAALHGVGGFDAAYIDEAAALGKELLALPPRAGPPSEAARDAIVRRNRLLQLLQLRVNLVRASARFVFRRFPEIVRESTSAYARNRRAAARRAKAALGEVKTG